MHRLVWSQCPRRPSSDGSAGSWSAHGYSEDALGVYDKAVSVAARAWRALPPWASGLDGVVAGAVHDGAPEPAG
eukprot:6595400-Alexandrium_andersonii.AAC.1